MPQIIFPLGRWRPNFEDPFQQIWDNHDFHYTFHNHFHPFTGQLIQRLNKGNLDDLMSSDLEIEDDDFFDTEYPHSDTLVAIHSFNKKIDLAPEGPYSIYNWELFYHIPLTIAVQLSKNQRFAEAQKWFHYIFDPTTNEPATGTDDTQRFWKFKHFRENTNPRLITQLLRDLSAGEDDPMLRLSIQRWRENPFSPHTVAKFRPLAYQFNVVMKYLDNLIAWGDSLFRQFTIETINEATQVYVLAANILGDKPQEVPRLKKRPKRTYKQLKDSGRLDEFSNALVEMENEFPLNSNIARRAVRTDSTRTDSIYGIGRQLYFCIPKNDKLLKYWDLVADRLFKIRHCMDIKGNVRQLPLFQPPIDPGLLVKAAAAGIDIGSVVAGLHQPVSNVRYIIILQKALELCGELRAMGNALLSAIEKGDAEKLNLIRQEHEINILELTKDVRYLQWKESEAATTALLKTRESAYQRYRHYQILLGKEEESFSDLAEVSITRETITEDNFDEKYESLVERYAQAIDLEDYREEKLGLLGEVAASVTQITNSVDSMLEVGSSKHLQLNKTEDIELNVFMPLATQLNIASGSVGAISTILSLIPQFEAKAQPLGVGAGVGFGGRQLSAAASYASQLIRLGGEITSYQGTRASKLAAYKRRIDDWVLQNNLAAKELQQIGQQTINSLLREQITQKEYENHQVQIQQSKTIDTFLKEQKFSSEELYLWMQGEIARNYYDCYTLAFDVAKKAEVSMKHELMRPELDERQFIQFNYWDGGRKGLLSGERLYLDLKRMELAYLEANKREYEITKHISLQQLNPLALLQLKALGFCEISIPEWLFDLDAPGHYMRRIKSVSISIPSIVGPYTSINCTLSLQSSIVRLSPLGEEYTRNTEEEDVRFKDYFGTLQSMVTSNAQNDSGLFEVNLRDDRPLPFEGAGVISRWRLELPHNPNNPEDESLRQFDYTTISDVIIHLRYTARNGGAILKQQAIDSLPLFATDDQVPLYRLFSLKHDFPNEWHRFVHTPDSNFTAIVKKEQFNYLTQQKNFAEENMQIQFWSIHNNRLTDLQVSGSILADGSNEMSIARKLNNTLSATPIHQSEVSVQGSALKDDALVFMIFSYLLV